MHYKTDGIVKLLFLYLNEITKCNFLLQHLVMCHPIIFHFQMHLWAECHLKPMKQQLGPWVRAPGVALLVGLGADTSLNKKKFNLKQSRNGNCREQLSYEMEYDY